MADARSFPPPLKIALIGDRGIPARYSGYSTLVEELAVRLQNELGFEVSVYARKAYFTEHPSEYRGVRLVWLPAPGGKHFESIVHSNLSVLHAALLNRYDLVFIVDPGNGPFCLPLKAAGVPVMYHTDGLGWKRTKWSRLQRRYYKLAERITAAWASWLVTDSREMVRYYQATYGKHCTFIPYGSIVGPPPSDQVLEQYGLVSGGYYLVAARMEPENNTDLIISEYKRSGARHPLVVVGSVPYGSAYERRIEQEASEGVRLLGGVYDPSSFNGLMRHCRAYLHGHEVGGTNPSLLRAMGAGAACLPLGVEFNREVVGHENPAFTKEPGNLAGWIGRLEKEDDLLDAMRRKTLDRSRRLYRWDAVAHAYARLFRGICSLKAAGQPLTPETIPETYDPTSLGQPWEDWPDPGSPA